ncbi:MAG TPA: lytic murein transglycosylase B [Burkholderiales bacterium]|nr:lytic murein transglycosylase B [Burkholderiales bacterium]
MLLPFSPQGSPRIVFHGLALLFGTLVLVGGCAMPATAAAQKALRPDYEDFIAEMVRKHEFRRDRLRRVFSQVQLRPAIIRAISTPATAKPWYEFRSRYVNTERIDGGLRFWGQNAAALARASREFGVPEEIIVAIIGIETHYGRNTGSFRVLDALATLAFDYPPRAGFFMEQLEEYLLLSREARLNVLDVKGSYAGAIGIPQFLPGSYRKYAIDFDGDGRRDLNDAADAIGSIANYLLSFGWQAGEPVAVPAEAGASDTDAMLAAGLKPAIKVGELRRRGITPLAPVRDEAEAALFTVETASGTDYWLGLQNFYVITRYNRSVNYAMAVRDLAETLRTSMQQGGEAVTE